MYAILRIIIGGIFIGAGIGKLLEPYQNFQYVIQAYEVLPSWSEAVVAQIYPWMELVVGVFVLLGLWTSWGLRGALVLFATFVAVIGQALIRGLPLENCGCFGGLVHFKPQTVIIMDSAGLLLTSLLLRNPVQTKKISLDSYFDKI
jgi:uncharacterized membrane protein YphA (DoxX/SURF4 family)